MASSSPVPVTAGQIQQAHQLYCQLTGQKLSLQFDRERQWYELLRQGFTCDDLCQVIGYLQREIRQQRRNVGALKLSNLLQPDRFEEDLNISRVRLSQKPPDRPPATAKQTSVDPVRQQQGRQRALDYLRNLKEKL